MARQSEVQVEIAGSVDALSAADWNACAGRRNPFVSHEFLAAMEQSGSAVSETGWQPVHLIVRAPEGGAGAPPLGILPAYAKSHSRGEYVFDHGWADAFERAGGRYYPKLQMSVPFTPAGGPRLLLRDAAAAEPLLAAAETLCRQNGLSSAHATFVEEAQVPMFAEADWLVRHGEQFHWFNRGYDSFEDFLASLSSRKRKGIRRERREAMIDGLEIVTRRGAEIREADWDAFWDFYQDTGARKWGQPYLTRAAFSLLGQLMGERTILLMAEVNGEPVAGALNFLGEDCIYGRYWGALADIPFLHFELCYYRAIDIAIEMRLARVEAGAQGEHKLARGYEPVRTYSAHWIANPGLRAAIADFLDAERPAVDRELRAMSRYTPFRKGD